jgi:hypothetical protein
MNLYFLVESKRNPGDVLKQYYLEELFKRIQAEEQHLPSFRIFIDFCNMIQPQLQKFVES